MNDRLIVMNVQLDDFAIMPTRAHKNDAGLDLYAPYDFWMFPIFRNRVFVNTGVHFALPVGTEGSVTPKSGLFKKYGILTHGTCDEAYRGAVGVTLLLTGWKPVHFKRGQKIAQYEVNPVWYPHLHEVALLDETDRGANGFGSTGK